MAADPGQLAQPTAFAPAPTAPGVAMAPVAAPVYVPPAGPTRAELEALGTKELRTKATAVGASADAIEDARDSDDPKGALINLILSLHP